MSANGMCSQRKLWKDTASGDAKADETVSHTQLIHPQADPNGTKWSCNNQ